MYTVAKNYAESFGVSHEKFAEKKFDLFGKESSGLKYVSDNQKYYILCKRSYFNVNILILNSA